MKQDVTIQDVAERAHVSTGTVSRVFNGHNVQKARRLRVLEAAKELDYQPNLYAKGMRSVRNGCFGIIVERVIKHNDPWLQKLVLSVSSAMVERGCPCMLDFFDDADEDLPRILKWVDGCVLFGRYPPEFFEKAQRETDIPLVTYGEKMLYPNGISLDMDWASGFQEAVTHLFALGHEKIGFVRSGAGHPSGEQKYAGYLAGLTAYGSAVDEQAAELDPNPGTSVFATAKTRTHRLLDRVPDVTGIVYASDSTAFGGIAALHERGFQIPRDISIVGADDTDAGRWMVPSLTTVAMNYQELSARLLEALTSLVNGHAPISSTPMTPRLIIRDTCGAPPGGASR